MNSSKSHDQCDLGKNCHVYSCDGRSARNATVASDISSTGTDSTAIDSKLSWESSTGAYDAPRGTQCIDLLLDGSFCKSECSNLTSDQGSAIIAGIDNDSTQHASDATPVLPHDDSFFSPSDVDAWWLDDDSTNLNVKVHRIPVEEKTQSIPCAIRKQSKLNYSEYNHPDLGKTSNVESEMSPRRSYGRNAFNLSKECISIRHNMSGDYSKQRRRASSVPRNTFANVSDVQSKRSASPRRIIRAHANIHTPEYCESKSSTDCLARSNGIQQHPTDLKSSFVDEIPMRAIDRRQSLNYTSSHGHDNCINRHITSPRKLSQLDDTGTKAMKGIEPEGIARYQGRRLSRSCSTDDCLHFSNTSPVRPTTMKRQGRTYTPSCDHGGNNKSPRQHSVRRHSTTAPEHSDVCPGRILRLQDVNASAINVIEQGHIAQEIRGKFLNRSQSLPSDTDDCIVPSGAMTSAPAIGEARLRRRDPSSCGYDCNISNNENNAIVRSIVRRQSTSPQKKIHLLTSKIMIERAITKQSSFNELSLVSPNGRRGSLSDYPSRKRRDFQHQNVSRSCVQHQSFPDSPLRRSNAIHDRDDYPSREQCNVQGQRFCRRVIQHQSYSESPLRRSKAIHHQDVYHPTVSSHVYSDSNKQHIHLGHRIVKNQTTGISVSPLRRRQSLQPVFTSNEVHRKYDCARDRTDGFKKRQPSEIQLKTFKRNDDQKESIHNAATSNNYNQAKKPNSGILDDSSFWHVEPDAFAPKKESTGNTPGTILKKYMKKSSGNERFI